MWHDRIYRFGVVGVMNTLVGYGIFAALIHVHVAFYLACWLATMCGVLFNFKSIGALVFRNTDNSLIWRFIAVYSCLFIINVILLAIGKLFISNMYLNGAACTLICAILAYIFNSRWVFREEL